MEATRTRTRATADADHPDSDEKPIIEALENIRRNLWLIEDRVAEQLGRLINMPDHKGESAEKAPRQVTVSDRLNDILQTTNRIDGYIKEIDAQF